RIDPERGGLLGVEGAIGLVLPAGALQRHARADEFDQVGAGDQVVDEGSGNAAGHGPSLPWRWRCGRRYLRLRMRWMSHSTTPKMMMNSSRRFISSSGGKLGPDPCADRRHVGTAGGRGLHLCHHLAHVLDGSGAGG